MSSFNYRALELVDLDKGYLEVLSQLSSLGEPLSGEVLQQRFDELKANEDYYILVAEDPATGRVIGGATLFLERKFLRGCRASGHIEDVVVDTAYRRLGVGKQLITRLVDRARDRGCYKVLLNCVEDKVPFYSKCGLKQKEVQMVKYFD